MIDQERSARLALLLLPGMGPARLRWATSQGSAIAAMSSIRRGGSPADPRSAPVGVGTKLLETWHNAAGSNTDDAVLEEHRLAGIQVLAPGDKNWPYADDPEPPALLFVRGAVDMLCANNIIGIVGTRRCTSVGRRVAKQMGAELAQAGVVVASGLALGIDGAAHEGALSSNESDRVVVGVVATGLDVPYPASHARLWDEVADRGVLISESPLGTKAQRWRFPARNRLLAGLSHAVVVVESHGSGGALSTVDEAVKRDVDVLVVPGSVLSAASDGSNALLLEGCAPVCSSRDVLESLTVSGDWSALDGVQGELAFSRSPVRDALAGCSDLERSVHNEVSVSGIQLEALLVATASSLPELVVALQRLETRGLIERSGSIVTLAEEKL